MNPFYSRLGIPGDIDTLSGLQRLVNDRVFETRHMDFKRQINDLDDLADDFAAIANVGGGALILGVAEDKVNRAESLYELPLNVVEQQSVQAARDGIDEPLIIEAIAVPSAKYSHRGFLVVAIPPSNRLPHITTKRGRVLHRVGTHNKPMTRREMGAAFAAAGEQFALEFGLIRGYGHTSITCDLLDIIGQSGTLRVMNSGIIPALNISVESSISPVQWARDAGPGEDGFMALFDEDYYTANPSYLPVLALPPGGDVILRFLRKWAAPDQDVIRISWNTPDGQAHQSEQSWSWVRRPRHDG